MPIGSLWHTNLPALGITTSASPLDFLFLLPTQALCVIAVAAVILIFPGDSGHHILEAPSMTFLVILVNQKGMNHFVNQSTLNLGKVVVLISEQLVRQVNLGRLKGLAASGKSFGKPASFVSTISCGGGHPSVPANWKVRNLAVEMFVVQSDKHCFDIGSEHFDCLRYTEG
jgi:hypothetical protein